MEQWYNLLNQMNHYYVLGKYEEALSTAKEILTQDLKNSSVYFIMANCYHNLNFYEKALDCSKEAAANGYSIEDCNFLMAKINLSKKDYIESERKLLETIRLNPINAEAIATYGYLMFLTGNDKKAAKLLKEAAELEPNNSIVLHFCFYYYAFTSNKTVSEYILQRYIHSADNEGSKLVKAGIQDLIDSNYKSARENFRQAFLLNPRDENLLALLEDLDEQTHPLFFIQRMIRKVGGVPIFYIVSISTILLLRKLNFMKPAIILAILYVSICIYTWISPSLYKIFIKKNINSR